VSEQTYRFAKAFASLRDEIVAATADYVGDVRARVWPDDAHSFH